MICIVIGERDTGLSTCIANLKWSTGGVSFESTDPDWNFRSLLEGDLDRYLNLAYQGRTVFLVFPFHPEAKVDIEGLKLFARHLAERTKVVCISTVNVWRWEE
jgi:hypothetical protein